MRGGQGEGESDIVPAEFLKGDFDDLGQAVAVEDVSDSVADIEHEQAQTAMSLIGTGALFIGGVTDASDGRKRAVYETNDFANENIRGGSSEEKPAVLATFAIHDACFTELSEDLLEKREGYVFAGGDFLEGKQIAPCLAGNSKINEGAQSVFAALGELHG